MRRLTALLVLLFALSGCGSSDSLEVQVERQAPPVAQILAMMPTEPSTEPSTEPTVPATTESVTLPTEEPTQPATEETVPETEPSQGQDFVLNKNTKKFHFPHCSSVKRMKDKNRWDYWGSHEEIVSMGYDPCKICKP